MKKIFMFLVVLVGLYGCGSNIDVTVTVQDKIIHPARTQYRTETVCYPKGDGQFSCHVELRPHHVSEQYEFLLLYNDCQFSYYVSEDEYNTYSIGQVLSMSINSRHLGECYSEELK